MELSQREKNPVEKIEIRQIKSGDLMKKNRLRLGILFYFDPSWMGGILYILNVIKTIDFLDDEDKPEIILFYRPDLRKYTDNIAYSYLKTVEWEFPSIIKGYLTSWLSGNNVFVDKILASYELDGLFPLHDYPVKTRSNTKLVSWYADLQHEYYPEFFTRRKILERTARIKLILRNSDDLVVSSKAVADDFNKFFRLRKTMKIHIFHFVSVIDNLEDNSIEELRTIYRLSENYFMVSNQFYKHKNHKVLLNSLAILKNNGLNINLALTGRYPDKPDSPYLKELHKIIENNQLQSQIRFLGVIPRAHQLMLMKHCQAVIQPSLFEGWSTVIEDAISLQVPVIASDIPVNIEQLGEKGVYFDPDNPENLASILFSFPQRNLGDLLYEEYAEHIKKAAKVFIDIFI